MSRRNGSWEQFHRFIRWSCPPRPAPPPAPAAPAVRSAIRPSARAIRSERSGAARGDGAKSPTPSGFSDLLRRFWNALLGGG